MPDATSRQQVHDKRALQISNQSGRGQRNFFAVQLVCPGYTKKAIVGGTILLL